MLVGATAGIASADTVGDILNYNLKAIKDIEGAYTAAPAAIAVAAGAKVWLLKNQKEFTLKLNCKQVGVELTLDNDDMKFELK